MKILILGSSGILGKRVTEKAIAVFGMESVIISDYKSDRLEVRRAELETKWGSSPGTIVINVDSAQDIHQGLEHIDYVFCCIRQKAPLVQKECIYRGISSIDPSVSPSFIEQVLQLNNLKKTNGTQLIMAGLFPGLSGILIKEIAIPDHVIDIGLLQSSCGINGKTGVSDMLQVLSKDVNRAYGPILNSRSRKVFDYPFFGRKSLRLVDFIERDYLLRSGIRTNIWTAFDVESVTNRVYFLKKMGVFKLLQKPALERMLSSFFALEDNNNQPEPIGLSLTCGERTISMQLKSDYGTTASCMVGYMHIISKRRDITKLVLFPHEVFSFPEMESELKGEILQIDSSLTPR